MKGEPSSADVWPHMPSDISSMLMFLPAFVFCVPESQTEEDTSGRGFTTSGCVKNKAMVWLGVHG